MNIQVELSFVENRSFVCKVIPLLTLLKTLFFEQLEKKLFNLKVINMMSRVSKTFCKVETSGTKGKLFNEIPKSF